MSKLHREDIKAEIRKKHGSLQSFERANKLPFNSTSDVLRGRSVGRTAKAIASLVGVSVNVISAASKNIKSDNVDNNKRVARKSHRLNEVAK